MKKVYSSLIMLFVTLAAFAQTLTADRVEVPQGRTAELTINITGAQQFIASGMYINLPQGFTFVYDDEEEAYCIPGTVFTKSHSIAERLQTATTLKLAISSLKNSAFKNNSGSLISVTIACGAGVEAGTYTGTLHGIEFSNLNNELVKIDDVAFTIKVPGSTDPEPTPTDTTTVTPTPVNPTPTDTTTVTPTPVNPTPTDTTTVTPTPTPGAVKSISAQNISVEAGSRATGIINITGATEYIAAGMYINIPQGFSFVYNDDEESYAVPGSVFSKSHSVTDRLQSSSVLKFAVVSSGNAKFKTAEGSLVSFDIACGANVAPGTYKASLNTIELSTVDNKLYKQDKVEFTITVLAKTNPQPVEPTPGDTTEVAPIPVTPEVASLSVTDVSVQAADRATAVVSVENAAQYIAAGMVISLPEGFMFEYNDSEESFCLPGDVLAKSHSIADNLQKTNVLKIAISSLKNANFGKDSGSLFSFTVKAAASVAAGTYTGTIKRTEFATEDNSLVTIPDETFTITVSPGSEPEPVEPVTTNNVSIDNISIEAGAQATATIKLKDASQYMAAGMFITLPDGFSFVYSDDAEGYCTQGNIFAKTHSISDNLQNASVLKFVVASIKNATFVDMANPTLLSFKLTCDETVLPGTYTAHLSGIELSAEGNVLNKEDDKTFTITVKNDKPEYKASSVVAISCSRIYGEENPAFKYLAIGGATYGEPEITCDATAESPVGTYPIRVAQGDMKNDKVSFIDGTLTILPAPLYISGGEYVISEGQRMPSLNPQYFGFKNGDDPSVLRSQPMLTTDASSDSAVGVYQVVPSGASARNYTICNINGTIKVVPVGDVDGDGRFTVDDVIQIIYMYIHTDTLNK